MPADERAVYRFGDVTLDTGRRRASRNGTEIQLGKLSYELLVLLAESAPHVVTPDEMAQRLWRGRFVSRNTIKQRVKLLRDALGDDAGAPRLIDVARGHGYRLIPAVEVATRAPQPSSLRSQRIATSAVVLAACFAALGIYWLTQAGPEPGSVADPIVNDARADRSIAILPFENLSPDPDDRYFVDGIHNDLLTQLSRIETLRVVSRTSVAGYRDRSVSLREIGEELGVSAVVEGSVQRSGDQIRINAQLVDTRSNAHLWAERYDRALTAENIFAIQSEMATSIAAALRAELTPDDRERLDRIPTKNAKAYNYYLLGQDHLRRPLNTVVFGKAAEAFEQAVGEDPEFALAWAALAHAYSAMYFFVDRTNARREKARAALERAFVLSPNLPEARLSRGYYHYQVLGDLEAALREWELAEGGMPRDPRIHMARGYVYRQAGRLDLASEHVARAIDLDPRNIEHLAVQYDTLALLHDYDRATRHVDRILRIAPSSPLGYLLKSQIALWSHGDGIAAMNALNSAPRELAFPHLRWTAALFERDYGRALQILENLQIETVDTGLSYRPRSWFFGITYDLLGRQEAAAPHYAAAREEAERTLAREPGDAQIMIAVADILGRQHDAAQSQTLALGAIEAIPNSVPAPRRHRAHLDAIVALVAAGASDSAIAELDRFFTNRTPWSAEGLSRHPLLDAIRDDPRFAALIDQYQQR